MVENGKNVFNHIAEYAKKTETKNQKIEHKRQLSSHRQR
jgi:hypothetical protein